MSAALKRVERAASRRAKARDELREAIVAADAQGETRAAISRAAGLSRIRIIQIINEAKQA